MAKYRHKGRVDFFEKESSAGAWVFWIVIVVICLANCSG